MDGYTLQLASDVLERDGLGLELYGQDGRLIAEVFRDDSDQSQTFATFAPVRLPSAIVEWFLEQATERLKSEN